MITSMVTMLIALLPSSSPKRALLRLLGHRIAPDASFGPCLMVNVGRLSMEPGARIGPFNVLRDLTTVVFDEGAVLGQFNWISAARPLVERGAPGTFTIGRESALTSRHYVDASGGVTIGAFTTVAGVRSTFITHGIDWKAATQSWKPIVVGDYCILGSTCAVTPGAVIPSRSIVGMGATIGADLKVEEHLYVSSRAADTGRLVRGGYFSRTQGPVE